jgi:hypothetical protein
MAAGFVSGDLVRIVATRLLLMMMNRSCYVRVMPATAQDAVYQHGKQRCDNKEQTTHGKDIHKIREPIPKCRSAWPEPQYQFPQDRLFRLATGVPGSDFLRCRHLRRVHPISQMSFRRMRQK